MNPKPPLVTVIVAVLNRAKTIPRCLNSITRQSYPYKELIIMDGGSEDGTVEILKAHNKDITFWQSEKDNGIAHAWNKALAAASGDWIYILGADDYLWTADVLERMVPHLQRAYPPIRVVYGKVAIIYNEDSIKSIWGEPWEKTRKGIAQGMAIMHQGALVHRSFFDVHGKFDESLRFAADYEMFLRELKSSDAFFVFDITVAGFQYGGLSSILSLDAQKSILKELITVRKKHGINGMITAQYWCIACALIIHVLEMIGGPQLRNRILDFYRQLVGKPSFWRTLEHS
jgi:hypothetical protein